MRSHEFVLLVYLAERQSALQPMDASAGVGPELTTVEVDGRGYVFDNHTVLALADQIRAEMAEPPGASLPPEVSDDDYAWWSNWAMQDAAWTDPKPPEAGEK